MAGLARALSLGSCEHLRLVRTLTWANGRGMASWGAVAFTVVLEVPRSIWCARGAAVGGSSGVLAQPLSLGVFRSSPRRRGGKATTDQACVSRCTPHRHLWASEVDYRFGTGPGKAHLPSTSMET